MQQFTRRRRTFEARSHESRPCVFLTKFDARRLEQIQHAIAVETFCAGQQPAQRQTRGRRIRFVVLQFPEPFAPTRTLTARIGNRSMAAILLNPLTVM